MYVAAYLPGGNRGHDPQDLKVWVTNEYEHNGLRADGERIFSRLLDMARGKI